MFTYPNRGKFLYSFKSLSLLNGAEVFEGLTSLGVNVTIEGREMLYGNGMRAYGRTRGNLQVEVEAKFAAEAFFDFQKAHPQFLTELFTFTVVNEESSRRDVIELVELSFEGADLPSEGTAPSEVTLSGMALDVLINDQSVIDDTRTPAGGG